MILLLVLSLILPVGVHDDSYLPITYSGSWLIVGEETAFGGSYRQTETGALSFSFHGSGFAIYATMSDTSGTANVCINEDCLISSWFADVTLHQQQVLAVHGLSGEVTVTITAQNNGPISVDAIYIAPAVAEPQPTADAPEWMIVSDDGQSLFEIRMTSGEQAIFLGVIGLMFIALLALIIQIRSTYV